MKSARNRGQAFEKKARFSAGTMRLGGYTCVYVCVCTPVAVIADDQRDAGSRKAKEKYPRDDKDDRARISRGEDSRGKKGDAS